MNTVTVLEKKEVCIKNENCELKKALIEIFLSYCKNGIALYCNDLSPIIMNNFKYTLNDSFIIVDLITKGIFDIHNIKEYNVIEYDDYLLIENKYNTIIIEELL